MSLKYYYSESTGLVKKEFPGGSTPSMFFDTLDEAYINFYIVKRHEINTSIKDLERRIAKRRKEIDKLDSEFGHLKEEYPENFL